MREGWERTTLSEIADINPEKAPKWSADHLIKYLDIAAVKWGKPVPTDIQPQPFGSAPGRARRVIREGDVVVSAVRPNLRSFAKVPAGLDGEVASTGFVVLRAKQGVEPSFIWVIVSHENFRDDLVSKATGSNYPAVRPSDVATHQILLPPISEQRRIVDLIGAVDTAIDAASSDTARSAHSQVLEAWMGQTGRPLSTALTLSKESIKVDAEDSYRVLGILRSGEGFIDRGLVSGSDTSYSRLFRVRPNQLVYRKLTAWEGPITVSTVDEEGGWVSNEFPVFDIDQSQLLPDLLRHMCRWPGLWHLIGQRLVGSVQRRKRLSPTELVKIEVPMPDLEAQREVCQVLDGLWEVDRVRHEIVERLQELRSNLLTALLSGKHEIPVSYDRLVAESTEQAF